MAELSGKAVGWEDGDCGESGDEGELGSVLYEEWRQAKRRAVQVDDARRVVGLRGAKVLSYSG